ncbi:acyl carrier protein [Streptomyces sp. NPDC015220]|uniref:acyl carrier protein n=1 Tax=Streptomyces sp. NPDC015220 TaxID=3364947 RepID=UPI003701BE24
MSALTIDAAVEAQVREIVADVLELEDDLTPTGRFVDDYGADSLAAIELLAKLEKTFGITIPQESLAEMVSLEAVLDVLARAEAR